MNAFLSVKAIHTRHSLWGYFRYILFPLQIKQFLEINLVKYKTLGQRFPRRQYQYLLQRKDKLINLYNGDKLFDIFIFGFLLHIFIWCP